MLADSDSAPPPHACCLFSFNVSRSSEGGERIFSVNSLSYLNTAHTAIPCRNSRTSPHQSSAARPERSLQGQKMRTRRDVLVSAIAVTVVFCFASVDARCDYPAFFNFGDSTSDTGAIHYSFPFNELAEQRPYGQTFFGRPVNRYSDGRLSVDFLASALGMPFLSPYLQSVGSNFQYGANFAAAGATARDTHSFIAPVSLTVQLNQFKIFKQQVLNSIATHGEQRFLPSKEAFSKGLYVVEIGGNDFSYGYMQQKMSPAQVKQTLLPKLAKTVGSAVQDLYNEGARTILVKDVGPQGCGAFWLTYFAPKDYDAHGCSVSYNDAVQYYNRILRAELALLRSKNRDANIVYVNTYDIIYDMFAHPRKYGFRETTRACCGVGGKYNYHYAIQCGSKGLLNGVMVEAKACQNPNSHVCWDGVHWTDAANRILTQKIISGKFFQPSSFSLASFCDLKAI